jgi:hypothetical protein
LEVNELVQVREVAVEADRVASEKIASAPAAIRVR